MRLVTYLAVSVLAASLVAAALYGPIDVVSKLPALTHVYTRWVPPEPPPQLDGLSEPERAAFRRLGTLVRGRVVWSSNREGNHELYLVDQRPATNSRPSAGSGTPGGRSIDVIFGTSNRRTISRKKISAIRT